MSQFSQGVTRHCGHTVEWRTSVILHRRTCRQMDEIKRTLIEVCSLQCEGEGDVSGVNPSSEQRSAFKELKLCQSKRLFSSDNGLMPETSASPRFPQRLAYLNQHPVDFIHWEYFYVIYQDITRQWRNQHSIWNFNLGFQHQNVSTEMGMLNRPQTNCHVALDQPEKPQFTTKTSVEER